MKRPIQTPQPLFGGYSQPTCPGIVLDGIDVTQALAHAESGTLTLEAKCEPHMEEDFFRSVAYLKSLL